MAKVTIVLDDSNLDEIDGREVEQGVIIDAKFDPEVPKDGELTLAQELGIAMLEMAVEASDVSEIVDEGKGLH